MNPWDGGLIKRFPENLGFKVAMPSGATQSEGRQAKLDMCNPSRYR
jgi:hypothetical protein